MATMDATENKTIKDGDIAPWKDFRKEKRKRNQIRPYLKWGGSSSVSIFFTSPERLRRSGRVQVEYVGDDM